MSRKTHPIIIRELGIEADQETAHELQLARKATARAAMQRIEQLREQPGTRPDSADRLHAIYDFRYRRAAQRAGLLGDEDEDLKEALEIAREAENDSSGSELTLFNDGA